MYVNECFTGCLFLDIVICYVYPFDQRIQQDALGADRVVVTKQYVELLLTFLFCFLFHCR